MKKRKSLKSHPSALIPALLSLTLVLMVWFVFGQTLTFDFVNYDDPQYVTDNPLVLGGMTWKGVLRALMHNDYSFYHPFTTISHMLDYEIYGINPAGFHFTNVVLHTMSAVILFLVLRSMTGSLWKSFMVAAVFAIHPLRAESVAWITERKDCLSGFFFMLTLAAYHRYVKGRRSKIEEGELSADYADGRRLKSSPQRTQRNTEGSRFFLCVPLCTLAKRVVNRCFKSSMFNYCLVFVCMAACMLSKATVVTLPFVLLLLDYWPLERWNGGRLECWKSGRGGGLTAKDRIERESRVSVSLACSNVWKILTAKTQRKEKDEGGVPPRNTQKTRKGTLGIFLKSQPSSVTFPPSSLPSSSLPLLVFEKLPFFLLSAVMAAVMVLSSGESMHSIEGSPLTLRLSNAVVSYVTYLGQLFVPVNLAVLYPYPAETIPFWKSGGAILFLGGITLFIVRAVCKNSAFRFLPQVSNLRSHPYLLTGWLWFLGMLVPMIGIVQAGQQAHADRYTYLSHIGLLIAGCWFVGAFRWVVSSRKNSIVSLVLAGLFLAGLMLTARTAVRSWRDSRSLWSQTLAHTEDNFVAHGNMGTVLFVNGETEASIEHFKKSLILAPNRSEIWNNLAVAYADLGQWEAAVLAARKALDCLTDDCREKNRALIREHLREYEEAFQALEKSIERCTTNEARNE